MTRSPSIASLAVVILTGIATAQEPKQERARPLPPKLSDAIGQRCYVDGTWGGYARGRAMVEGTQRVRLLVPRGELRGALESNRDGQGASLRPRSSRARVVGRVVRQRGRVILRVEQVLELRRHLGGWVTRAELREKLGCARTQAGWVPSRRATLLEARSVFEPWPTVDEELLWHLARQGKLAPGMNKLMAVTARSYPRHTDRIRQATRFEQRVWEQWILPDGSEIYFLNGQVFRFTRRR